MYVPPSPRAPQSPKRRVRRASCWAASIGGSAGETLQPWDAVPRSAAPGRIRGSFSAGAETQLVWVCAGCRAITQEGGEWCCERSHGGGRGDVGRRDRIRNQWPGSRRRTRFESGRSLGGGRCCAVKRAAAAAGSEVVVVVPAASRRREGSVWARAWGVSLQRGSNQLNGCRGQETNERRNPVEDVQLAC